MSGGPEDLLSQREKRSILENDARAARERASTYHQFTVDEVDTPRGRYSAQEKSTVVGSTSAPDYPVAFHQHDPVPDEPPLGVSVNEMIPVGEAHEVEKSLHGLGATGLPCGQPDGGAVEDPASGFLLLTGAVETTAPPAPTTDNSDDNSDDEPPEAA